MKTKLEIQNSKLRQLNKKYKTALEKIESASQIKHEARDYANIGKNAIFTAKEALHKVCPRCGK